METILFKGKSKLIPNAWPIGYYEYDANLELNLIRKNGILTEIVPGTVCIKTGRKLCKGHDLWENDIVFEEIEENEGDRRMYYVCKWIPDWARFVFLSIGELICYQEGGVKELENDGGFGSDSFGVESSEILHYAGNYIDNPELLIA